MPKHSWKWRTEQVRKLTPSELLDYLYDWNKHMSAKLARYIYEHICFHDWFHGAACVALDRIGWDEQAPWTHSYLWRELRSHKHTELGDAFIIALARFPQKGDLRHYLMIYNDETAHDLTRGSAIFGIISYVEAGLMTPEEEQPIRGICLHALTNKEIPYARAGACWLARQLKGFEDQLRELTHDESVVVEGPDSYPRITVAEYAKDALGGT